MLLSNEKIQNLELSTMEKRLIQGMMEQRNEQMQKYSELRQLVEKVFISTKKIKEIHTISDGIYVIEEDNPFKEKETDSDSFYSALVDGKKAHVGTLSLDAAILLAICFKHGETDFSRYAFKVLNIE